MGSGAFEAISASNDSILNNTFYHNSSALAYGPVYYAALMESGNAIILNNIITGNQGSGIDYGGSGADYNVVHGNTSDDYRGVRGLNDIPADPKFVNATAGDFTLLPSSPCIDRGNPDTVYNDPDGSRNDIGAYPFGHLIRRTLRVPAEYATIQAALDSSVNGDTVLVMAGSYPDAFSIRGGRIVHVLSESGADHTFLFPTSTVGVNDGSDAQIIGFTFTRGGSPVINVGSNADIDISRCKFRGFATGYAVSLSDNWYDLGTSASISYCLFALQTQKDFFVVEGSPGRTDFVNNTVDGGWGGIAIGEGSVRNNIFTNLPGTAVSVWPATTVGYNDVWDCGTDYAGGSLGFGALNLDPQYVNAAANCYELRPSSPCIDAGDPDPSYNNPDGSRNDMGVYPFNPDSVYPVILGIVDVPHDQGGRVTVRWAKSKYDSPSRGGIPEYSVWRSIPPNGLTTVHAVDNQMSADAQPSPSQSLRRTLATTLGMFEWEWIGSIPGHYFDQYSFTATTLYDSSGMSDGKHYFLVSAHSPDGVYFYDSQPDSGHSVDNLAPPAPLNLAVSERTNGLQLVWGSSAAQDLSAYRVYRDTVPGFQIAGATPISFPADTLLIDATVIPGEQYYYRVTAADYTGNESPSSNEASGMLCDCQCLGDPLCDGIANIQDVVQAVNVAFRGAAPVFDPQCAKQRTDVNCDGFSTVQDVVKVVNVAFRGANPATEFCEPCGM